MSKARKKRKKSKTQKPSSRQPKANTSKQPKRAQTSKEEKTSDEEVPPEKQTQDKNKASSQEPKKNEAKSPKKSKEAKDEAQDTPRSWGQRLRSWGLQGLLLLAVYAAVTAFNVRSLVSVGAAAPSFQLRALDGKLHDLQQYKGRRVILHFWATWCSVCKVNIPTFRWLHSSYNKDPIFLSVVADSQRINTIKALKQNKQINYPILLAKPHILRDYRIQKYPTTYFIDAKGRIAAKDAGYLSPIGLWWRSFWVRLKSLRSPV